MKNLIVILFLVVNAAYCFKLPFSDYELFQSRGPLSQPSVSQLRASLDPDCNRTTPEIIESRGFIAETHYVTTADGYILGVFRIKNPSLPESKNRTVIILQHGLLASSDDYILNSPTVDYSGKVVGNNLGFVLSVRGYDVWLTNSRGNVYSRNHTTLDPKHDRAYWKFSYDEMSEYDLPAVISYIRSATGKQTVGYIGHSQGTTIMFGLLSSQPQYADIVKPFIALAPVARISDTESPIRVLADNPLIIEFFYILGGEFLPENALIEHLAQTSCAGKDRWICYNMIFLLCGWDLDQMNQTRLPVFVSHDPAGTSSWNLVHWAQGVTSRRFQRFDYGPYYNEQKYGSIIPPEYDLSKITSENIALLHSENDFLADPADVNYLRSKLRVPLLSDYNVPLPKWNHLDFLMGKDAGALVYTEVLRILGMKEW